MDTTIVPTPQFPDSPLTSSDISQNFSHHFTHIPAIGTRWTFLERGLLSIGAVPDSALSLAKHRMSEVLGVSYLLNKPETTPIENGEFIRSVAESLYLMSDQFLLPKEERQSRYTVRKGYFN